MSNQKIPKQADSKEGQYGLKTKFPGYNSRQDKTTLDPSFMIPPSQNVLIGTSGRVGLVKGYTLDGAGSAVIDSGILSNYDFTDFVGNVRNMRAGFMTSAANDGKLQYRYVDSSGNVSWINLMTSLTSIRLCFCDYWDNTALIKYTLWVDGSNNVYSWNGAVGTVASATSNTVTLQGTQTWQQLGYTATGSITIGGVTATYSGGSTSGTLTGVSVDFSATPVGAEVHQTPVVTALSSMTAILSTFSPTVIGCGRANQVYLGSNRSNNLYISKVNNYKDYSFTSPTRIVGEGDLIPLDAFPVKFIAQEVYEVGASSNSYDMYVAEYPNTWGVIRSTLSSDNTAETLQHIRLKVAPLQSPQSERLATKMKNHIMFVGNDNVANFFGYISYQFIPAIEDFSYPIIDDMNSYDFTDGSIFYYKNYVYIAVPKESLIRVYNMTDQTQQQYGGYKSIEDVSGQPFFWEAPITYPISGFYVTEDGLLGGHSYTTSESYMLFNGGSFNGQEIDASAIFALDDKGDRTQSKASDECWIEGYISQNTLLNTTIYGDLDSFQSQQTVVVNGSDPVIVAFGGGAHSLGKNPYGSQPLGGSQTTTDTLPAWFHVSKTYVQVPSYLEGIGVESKGVDLQWELIAIGTNSRFTPEGNNAITQ